MTIKMYCIFSKESIEAMGGNRGKMAAQAGHAYLHAYWDAEEALEYHKNRFAFLNHKEDELAEQRYTYILNEYKNGKSGATKICLIVDTNEQLQQLQQAYKNKTGTSLVVDSGKTVFNGQSTITCLGIGPIDDNGVGDDLRQLKVFI